MGRTVTFLFTDIETSTERWRDDTDSMADALAAHDAVLAEVIAAHEGHIFKHTGDGVCAVFDSAIAAVAAAQAAQQRLTLPVRMGLHTGEALERGGDYFGITLSRTARIMDAGHGGQVLMSASTRALVDGAPCVDLGEYTLKGLAQPERIHQVGHRAFPPLRVRDRRTSLPTALTPLVGRDELVADVTVLLASTRLVTLVGVGGVGKTRTAISIAEGLAPNLDLTVFVDLSEISDEGDVLPTAARALGLPMPSAEALSLALADRRTLVVLDNCEHVLDGAAELAEQLLRTSPSLTVLATSREGLDVPGEQLVNVPGLHTDDGASPAAELFVERARAADASFDPGDQQPLIEEICRRLDGLPLAIELAAARVNVLGVEGLLERLDQRFDVLTGGRRRRGRDRQRTLRETIDWSYDLLDADEQRALDLLSVFAGSFDLESAGAVLDIDDPMHVIDLIDLLVSKSLATRIEEQGLRRYRYLETVRSYAHERLVERGEQAAALQRLEAYLTDLVDGIVDATTWTSLQPAALLRVELPNLRVAFDAALDRSDVAAATALIGPLAALIGNTEWSTAGWADEALALPGAVGSRYEPELRALGLIDAWLGGRFAQLHSAAVEVLELAARWPNTPQHVRNAAAFIFSVVDDRVRYRETWPHRRGAFSSVELAEWAWSPDPGAADDMPEHLHAELDLLLTQPSPIVRGNALVLAAIAARRRNDDDAMLEFTQQALDTLVTGSANWFAALQIRSWAEFRKGDFARALASVTEDLDHAYRVGDGSAMIMPLVVCALILQALDEPEAAATVRGRLPRRLTLFLVEELAELDRWLGGLAAERRRELAEQGRVMDARQLQALTLEVAARHVDLTTAR